MSKLSFAVRWKFLVIDVSFLKYIIYSWLEESFFTGVGRDHGEGGETRREYIPVGSSPASMPAMVSHTHRYSCPHGANNVSFKK